MAQQRAVVIPLERGDPAVFLSAPNMPHTIFIHPEKQYTFRQNISYEQPWNFLPDKQRRKVIAEQLTYLQFHEWLFTNLRQTDKAQPTASDLNEVRFHVREGFFRTDVLLYASICEAALYVVAKEVFDSKTTTQKPEDLLAAFQTSEQKIIHLGKQTFTTEGDTRHPGCKIGYCYPKEPRKKSDSQISFDSLIKAARSIDAIDDTLEKRLDELRDARNTIHLGTQIARKPKGPFDEQDRKESEGSRERGVSPTCFIL